MTIEEEQAAEIERLEKERNALREENARLREALKTFALKAPVQLTCDGGGSIRAIIVMESELNAARAAIRNGEK